MNDRSSIFDEPTRPTKRAEKERARAFRLVDCALELFSKHGYDSVSVKKIAEAAGMAQGSLYNYFSNKEDLYWAVLARHGYASHAKEIIEHADGKPVRDVLLEIGLHFHEYLSEHKPLIHLILAGSHTNPEVADLFARYIETDGIVIRRFLQGRVDRGELRPHDVKVTLQMLLPPILFHHVFGIPKTEDFPGFIRNMVDVLMTGLQPVCEAAKAVDLPRNAR